MAGLRRHLHRLRRLLHRAEELLDGDAVSNRPRRTLRVRQGIAEYRVVVERGGLRPVEVLDGERFGS